MAMQENDNQCSTPGEKVLTGSAKQPDFENWIKEYLAQILCHVTTRSEKVGFMSPHQEEMLRRGAAFGMAQTAAREIYVEAQRRLSLK